MKRTLRVVNKSNPRTQTSAEVNLVRMRTWMTSKM